jgi:pimeloyl-ACP methyl ester carboxylesterase
MMGPFQYFPLAFSKDGTIVDQSQFAAVISAVSSDALTDLIVISHGWNDDMPEAEALYSSIFTQVGAVLPLRNPACDAVRARRVAVVGILWPSKKFDDSSLIPGGAAALGDGTADATQAVDRLSTLLDSPDASQALERAKSLIPQLGDSMDARDEFGRLIRAFMPHEANDEEPVIDPSLFTLTGDELLRRLARPVRDSEPATQGGAAGLGDWFGKVADGARNLANLVTYYQMKSRAGAIGQGGVRDVLERIRNDRPASGPKALAIHLVGHSFGGRLVTAAVEGPEGAPPLPVSSLVLLQAAFSHYGFALAYDGTHDGFFRRVVTDPAYVTGVVAITFTAKDKAVGLAYPIASRIARQIAAALGDAGDPYGGLGRNGAQKTPGAKTVTLAVPGSAYGFVARGIYNLDSNQTIGGHSDLAHPEVAYALLSAMAAAQP